MAQTWLCVLCEKDVTEDDYRREVDCPNTKCPGRVYHEDCIANYLKKTKYSKDRCTGFPCPVVLPTGKQCPGYVCKMHSFFPMNQKKKAARVAAAAQAAAQVKAKPPVPQPKPKQAGVVAAITAMKSGVPQPVAVKVAAKPLAVINGCAQATVAAAPRLIPGLTGAFQDPAALRAQVAKLRAEAKSPAVANANPDKAGGAAANNTNRNNRTAVVATAGNKADGSVDDEERGPRQATLWDAIGNTGFGTAQRGDAAGWMESANLNVFTMDQHAGGRPAGNFSALLQRRKAGGAGTAWNKMPSAHDDGSESDATGVTASCDGEELGLDLSHANSSLLLSPVGNGGGMASPRSATDVAGFPALPTKDPPPPALHVSNPNNNGNANASGRPFPSGDYVDDDVDILALVAAQEEKERQQQEALRHEIELQQRQLAAGGADIADIAAAGLTDMVITNTNNDSVTDTTDPAVIAAVNTDPAVAAAADPVVVAYDIVYASEGQEVVLEPTSNAYYRLEDVYGVPRAALAFVDCPGVDGNTYRCVAVTATMAAARHALAKAWLQAQEAARAAEAAAQLLLQQQQAQAQRAVVTASELMFGVQHQAAAGWGGADAALVAAKVSACGAAGSPYGGEAKGAVTVEEGGEDDDTDVSDLMALLCA